MWFGISKRRKAIYMDMEREMLCKHMFTGLCRDSGLLFSRSVVSNTVTSCTAACQASLSFTISQRFLKLMSIESMMPSNHLILGLPFLLLPSVFPRIRVFSSEPALCIRWPKYRSFSCRISPLHDYSGLISTN